MKSIITSIVFLIAFISQSQNCDIAKNEFDNVTKKHVVKTKQKSFTISGMGFGTSTAINVKRVDNYYYLGIQITSPDIFSVENDSDLVLQKENGELIKLPFNQIKIADGITTNYGNTWTLRANLFLEEEELNMLSSGSINRIRINMSEGYFEDKVKRRKRDLIANMIDCVKSQHTNNTQK